MTIIFVTNVHAIICSCWHISRPSLLWGALNAWHTPPWFPWFPSFSGPLYPHPCESPPTLPRGLQQSSGTPFVPPCLALVQLVTLCVYVCVHARLFSSCVLFILRLAFPAQPFFWSQTTCLLMFCLQDFCICSLALVGRLDGQRVPCFLLFLGQVCLAFKSFSSLECEAQTNSTIEWLT